MADLICLSRAAWPAKGTVSTRMPEAAQAAEFSSPETLAAATFCLILAAAAWARAASRDPMMMVSPHCAQRKARPKPSGPVPPRTAMGPLIGSESQGAKAGSRELRDQPVLGGKGLRLQLEGDAGVGRVALGGNAA